MFLRGIVDAIDNFMIKVSNLIHSNELYETEANVSNTMRNNKKLTKY